MHLHSDWSHLAYALSRTGVSGELGGCCATAAVSGSCGITRVSMMSWSAKQPSYHHDRALIPTLLFTPRMPLYPGAVPVTVAREMFWSVLIVTACGIAVSISSPNQNDDEYRYIRRVALLWAQNLLLSLMVFTPLCLAIRARKKRKVSV